MEIVAILDVVSKWWECSDQHLGTGFPDIRWKASRPWQEPTTVSGKSLDTPDFSRGSSHGKVAIQLHWRLGWSLVQKSSLRRHKFRDRWRGLVFRRGWKGQVRSLDVAPTIKLDLEIIVMNLRLDT